ncbi:hypothetical protein [Legionella spiritensis]|uniref:hypothetical protein n=1 Tax=Legionella spiritensis TaxID=452 RepID=UPI000F6EB10A|nr:hypothetical protein [Legionella spiritensis]VEG92104.1 Uncharacterised protein [Legionella spiritensis]
MIEKLFFITVLSLSSWAVAAYSDNAFSILKHKEWQTGEFDIKFSTSSPSQVLKIDNKKEDVECESMLLMPTVESIHTDYRQTQFIHTNIKTRFQIQLMNYYAGSEEQQFDIYRQICIYPHKDTPTNQFSCVNSNETISAKDDMTQIVDIDMQVYNLIPGKYFVEMELSVLPLKGIAVKYRAHVGGRHFTVKQ